MSTAALGAFGLLLGLVAGSFLNVVVYRVPRGMSIVTPRSACPGCGTPIRPRDNVPVLSWLLLRARCRECGTGISVRYPLVEAGTGAVFAWLAVLVGAAAVLPAYWVMAATVIALALVDLETKRLPNAILYPGGAAAILLLAGGAALDGSLVDLGRALAGGAGAFALFLLIALAARGGFGFGDVKLSLLLGVFLAYRSWGTLLVGVFAAFLIGGVAALALLAAGRVTRRAALPFGPAMVAGAFLALAVGESVASWYVG